MVGGDEATLAKIDPLFKAMGKQVFRMGETSKGQAAKLVMNLQIALIYEGFAEALTLLFVDSEPPPSDLTITIRKTTANATSEMGASILSPVGL